MRLIERFAIIRVGATPHFFASSQFHFQEPVGIGKRLASETSDVGLALLQNRLGLLKSRNASGGYNRRRESCFVHGSLDLRDQRHAAAKRARRIGKNCRHTLVATLPGVGINCLPNFRSLCVFKFPAL